MAGYYKLNLFGKRFLISGSADLETNLHYAHNLIRSLVEAILLNNAGLVVNIGKEPILEKFSPIFDWTILETVGNFYKKHQKKPVSTLGPYVLAYGLKNWKKNIPPEKHSLWKYLVANNLVDVIQLKENLSFGGKLRELQSSMADLLITLGGKRGVHHSVDLFIQSDKPVIPLNIPLGIDETASEIHYRRLCETPEDYLEVKSDFNLVAHLSLLNLKELPDIDTVKNIIFKIVNNILPPKAFFIRLLNTEHEDYQTVETYFRMVVDPVLESLEFRRFESGLDQSNEPFMNIEIFNNLHFSSLAFADLTGLRSNCFLELGYSLGQQKKYLLSAKKGTSLPFDTKMIYCHFWDLTNGIEIEKMRLTNFIKQHINKNPLISI